MYLPFAMSFGMPELYAAIASYNAGIPRFMANGKYMNQHYVDKVNAYLKLLRAEK